MLAIDRDSTSYWQSRGAAGAALEVSFDRPVELAKIGITPGTPEDYLAEPRPSRLHVVFSDGAGNAVGSSDLNLVDEPKFQVKTVKAKNVVRVQISISEVVPAQQGGGDDPAIATVEFRTLK